MAAPRDGQGPTYLVGPAATPGVPDLRQFLSRNGVAFQWVDADHDPLVSFLAAGPSRLGAVRFPLVVFGDGTTLEGPARYMRTLYVEATRGVDSPAVSADDRRAHVETAQFKHDVATRPRRPELYVTPERRGRGIGRALLEAAMQHARQRGAVHIELGTSESDIAARALYENAGFTNHEDGPDGPRMLCYERDL